MTTMDTRYSFTAQFLRAAKFFALEAENIEAIAELRDDDKSQHRAFVVGAIMQSTAALEAEAAELMMHGPGHHLGSSGVDVEVRDFLKPLGDAVDRVAGGVLERYFLVLHLLHRAPMERGAEPVQSATLLVRLRNELVHYKSKWGQDMEKERLFASLQALALPKPRFVAGNANYFPHRCLSAACADWAWRSALAFLDGFFEILDAPNPIDGYRTHFT